MKFLLTAATLTALTLSAFGAVHGLPGLSDHGKDHGSELQPLEPKYAPKIEQQKSTHAQSRQSGFPEIHAAFTTMRRN